MSGTNAERDTLLSRLARFEKQFFPRYEQTYRELVAEGQHPKTLFIGCSDSRIVPYALMDCGPGELFIARNVGNLIPPWDMSAGFHGTAAAIEFAVLQLQVQNIVICGHSHCGAIRALYEPPPAEATHLNAWLDYYVIEEGQVLVLEAERGAFVAHAGLGQPIDTAAASAIIDGSERSGADPRVSEIDASHWFRMPERAG